MGNSAQKTLDIKKDDEDIDIDYIEATLSDIEYDYPLPCPPVPLHQIFKNSNCWTADDNFKRIGNDAELLKKLDFVSLDLNTMSDEYVDDDARDHKLSSDHQHLDHSFDAIDNHARMADPKLLDSFTNLFDYLKEPLLYDQYKNTRTARAILVWLSRQDLEGRKYGKKSTESPRGLMQCLKESKISYTVCYAFLCRKAGLKCAIVDGYIKAGAGDGVYNSSWNAVYVESGWQIVQADWACRAVFGYNSGEWTKIEEDGLTMSIKEKASAGTERNIFNEAYFMPIPEQFIYQCCAVKEEWQLVPLRSSISSNDVFERKPFLFFPFFELGLKLVSLHNCVLESKDGICKIEFRAKPGNAHMIELSYELFRKDPDADPFDDFDEAENYDDSKDVSARMVFNSRCGEVFTFEIRFPKTGIYKLIISGGLYRSIFQRLCEFKLICKQAKVGNTLLPIDSGKIGWGPGPAAKDAGLFLPTKPSGLIPVNESEKKTDVKFQLRDITESYTAVVHGEVSGRRKKVENSVQVEKIDYSQQLVVTVSLPEKGEYGLSIRHMVKNTDWEDACHYLLSTLAFKFERANVRRAKERLKDAAEKHVEARHWKEQIQEIRTCIAKCQKEKVPENADEMITAYTKLVLLTCRDKLRDCLLRRNTHFIQKTLSVVSMYRDQEILSNEVMQVKQLLDEIIALGRYIRMVPTLEEAHKEIIALKHAPDEVYNTFKALLVLLGEPTCKYVDWTSIKTRMMTTHHLPQEESILNKMKQIQKQEMNTELLQKASKILHYYTADQVRKVNSDAHSFYVWIENIINVHKGK